MALVVALTGDQLTLTRLLSGGLTLHLSTSNRAAQSTDTVSSWTEASGYTPVTLNVANFTFTTSGTVITATMNAPIPAIAFTATATIYAAYYTDSMGNTLYGAEVLSGGPFAMTSGGNLTGLVPKFTQQSAN